MPEPEQKQNSRKRSAPTDSTSDRNKRARFPDARTIAVQSSNPSIREGALDVQAFIRTREFEINALNDAMGASRRASTKRAFQSVPRDMRRRTASHNAQRVPKRLRSRAKKEMITDNTPTHTFRRRQKKKRDWLRAQTAEKLRSMKPKGELTEKILDKVRVERKKVDALREPPRPHSKFRKRQRGKTWLPTHVWHAKRAKMEIKWRFAVPWTPNTKSFRPTHRAAEVRGAVAWDASYFSTILVKGNEDELEVVYKKLFAMGSIPTARVRAGKRTAVSWAYRDGLPIAPVTAIWCASDGSDSGKLLLRVHPSAFLQLWEATLKVAKEKEDSTITVEDLRFEIGSIEITGPAATDALLSVLTPADDDEVTLPSSNLWRSLRGLITPATLPPGVVFGLEVIDPRLRFPPRLDPSTSTPEETESRLFEISSTWPLKPTSFALFDQKKRTHAVKLQPSQKRITKRKAGAKPGTYPPSLPLDPRIPVLIFSSPASPKAPSSWTVLLPWKWVQPVWYSLMHTQSHVRFGGVQEMQQLCFDHGLPWFPADFPGTPAGKEEEETRAQLRMAEWARKPKGKRTEWTSVKIPEGREIGDWSRCDWKWLLPGTSENETPSQTQPILTQVVLPSSNPTVDSMDTDTSLLKPLEVKKDGIWQIPPTLTKQFLNSPKTPPDLGLPLDLALFTVRITLAHRGSPTARARIYCLTDTPLSERWRALGAKRKEKQRVEPGHEKYPPVPPAEDVIGFVTTGNYSLSDGKSVAVGAVAWKKVFESTIEGQMEERWCVVRDVGSTIGRLARWEPVVL